MSFWKTLCLQGFSRTAENISIYTSMMRIVNPNHVKAHFGNLQCRQRRMSGYPIKSRDRLSQTIAIDKMHWKELQIQPKS